MKQQLHKRIDVFKIINGVILLVLSFRTLNMPDLTVDALHHGFVAAVFFSEDLDKLLGSHIIGQRPQALAGAAG